MADEIMKALKTADGSPLLARGLEKRFPLGRGKRTVQALRGVDFEARKGEFVSIVGPSGSGKSTLLYCLSGLEEPTGGETWIEGTAIYQLTRQRRSLIRRETLGFVFQDYNLIESLDVQANVELPLRFAHHAPRLIRSTARDVMRCLDVDRLRHAFPADLSGGERQRVAIARTLACGPSIVFADEPTGALDSRNTSIVAGLLRDMADEGSTVVMVTHDLDLAARADRSVILRDGRVSATLEHPDAATLLSLSKEERH